VRCLGFFLIITCALVLLLLIGSWIIGATSTLARVDAFITSIRLWLYSVQIALIAILWWKWGSFISWLERRGTINERMRGPLLASRHRITGAILAIQVLVVMGIPFHNSFSVH
jgi:hypothetical protein